MPEPHRARAAYVGGGRMGSRPHIAMPPHVIKPERLTAIPGRFINQVRLSYLGYYIVCVVIYPADDVWGRVADGRGVPVGLRYASMPLKTVPLICSLTPLASNCTSCSAQARKLA